jgi:hypothetical protein
MFQKCPICQGSGIEHQPVSSGTDKPCPVCGGMKIISELTGKPPKHDGDHCPHDPSKIKLC